MIDYQKLEEAHEIAEKLDCAKLVTEARLSDGEEYYMLYWFSKTKPEDFCTYDLDKLITKLKELTHPQKPLPKYKRGDIVFAINKDDFTLIEMIVSGVDFSEISNSYLYSFGNSFGNRLEDKIYPSREALIQSQIEYWQSLSEDKRDIDEILYDQSKAFVSGEVCNHDMIPLNMDQFMRSFCKKCGLHTDAPIKECKHESDGMIYCSNPPKNRCKKCGEFYR